MDSLGIRLLEGLLVVTFILLTIQKRNGMWLFSAAVFTLTAALIKYSIDIRDVKDFAPYFASFRAVKDGTVPTELLIEPYRLALFKVVIFFGNTDDLTQIGLIYYFQFLVVTGFFLWLAYLKEVTFELKLVLFLAFFPTMAFVWIRSGMVYVASCVLFLTVTSGRLRVLQFLLPLIHTSVLPLLVAMKIKDFSPMRKGLIILVSVVAGFFILESSYFQYIIHKLDRYSETSDRRTSIDLLLFHAANILTFIYLALINSKFRKNFVVLVLMGAYILLYFVNPIAGIRVFPLVLIAGIVQRISFPRYQHLTLWVCAAYVPVYFARFDQIFI
jgi:hypothetical protein